jgi:choline dehydrogenase-like flavoprotein
VDVLIIGAGPAAAAAALALSESSDNKVRILDVGGRLEDENELARLRLSRSDPSRWEAADLRTIRETAVQTKQTGLPEKRIFGSDFPFRDFGQLEGLHATGEVNPHVISGAYGGFSNTWGAQSMMYSAASFNDWPFPRSELEKDYRAILSAIPYAAEEDDLTEYFPLWGDANALPPLSESSQRIIRAYERNRVKLRRHGVIVGKARLAMRGDPCISCGLCMTGCPYSLVYSASHTIDDLVNKGRVEYLGGYVALQLSENEGRPSVAARSLHSGHVETFSAGRIFVACGALGTTRLVAHSIGRWSAPIHMSESVQFLIPFLSPRGTKFLKQEGSFTLNQFNMVLPFDEIGHDLVQIHGYPYNEAMDSALPGFLRHKAFGGLKTALLKRITVGLGYLPSWWSPGFDVVLSRPDSEGHLSDMTLQPSGETQEITKQMLRAVIRRLVRSAPSLGVLPVVPQITLAAPGKSYHFGGSFPHALIPRDGLDSDVLGRVHPWQNIHLVDASVFPTVPATTFTLSIMANAHRIARLVAEDIRG